MYNTSKEKRKVILPTNDLNFKRLFASPELIHISRGFLQDLAAYDPLGLLHISFITIETPYNFQEVNRLRGDHEAGLLNTEVDYACRDENGVQFLLEMQKRDQVYLEERVVYNVGQRFSQNYARNDGEFSSKYASLKPVIAVIILEDKHFEDDVAIRFLRPHDERQHVYKKNLNLGLEIYVEINKDTSQLPKNLQLWMEYFKTGRTPEEAPCYLQEAANMTDITSFTKEERELADLIDKMEQKRIAEDAAIRLKAEAAAKAMMAEAEAAVAEAEAAVAEAEAKMQREMEAMLAKAEAARIEAIKDGIQQGIEQGIGQGIKQERKRFDAEKLEIAKSLLQANMSVSEVAKHSKLSIEKIKELIV